MPEEGKLINVNVDLSGLRGLSDGVKVFVERISTEIGAFTKPHHKRRMAQAKADAAVIAAEGKIRLTELQERGLQRVVLEVGRRQENIESIARKAIPHIKDNANANNVEADWLADFFDKAKLTSNQQIQEIWARLLAEEINTPSAVSRRTTSMLAQLESKDAQLFSRICSTVWAIGEPNPVVFWNSDGQINQYCDLNFVELKHLDSLGLINFESVTGFRIMNQRDRDLPVIYGAKVHVLQFREGKTDLQIGNVMFTQAGLQLFRAIPRTYSDSFYAAVLNKFIEAALAPFSPTTNPVVIRAGAN